MADLEFVPAAGYLLSRTFVTARGQINENKCENPDIVCGYSHHDPDYNWCQRPWLVEQRQ
jgi:hypothetical protein